MTSPTPAAAASFLVDAALAVAEAPDQASPLPSLSAPISHKAAIQAVSEWVAKEVIRTPLSENFITRMVHIALQAARPHFSDTHAQETLEG